MAAEIMTPFEYTPLSESGHIRFCTLLPGEPHEEIRCRIEPASLSSNTAYEALSYTWGDRKNETYIFCNNAQSLVLPNLVSALQHLRYSDRERVLWIDRLCINQEDNVERSRQVMMMDKIFSLASLVIVWLGEPPPGDRLPLDLMSTLCKKILWPTNGSGDDNMKKILQMSNSQLEEEFQVPPPEAEAWQMMRRLLENPWFHRSWVYQEVILGKSVQLRYGPDLINFDVDEDPNGTPLSFQGVIIVLYALVMRPVADARIAEYVQYFWVRLAYSKGRARLRHWCGASLSDSLLVHLEERRFCKTTDPKDKIYSLLSIASDRKELGIVPNYEASDREVYTSTARRMIEKSKGLELLSCLEPLGGEEGFPSWVQNWDYMLRAGLTRPSRDIKGFYATGNSKSLTANAGEASKLGLRGVFFDVIDRLGDLAENEMPGRIGRNVLDGGQWSTIASDLDAEGIYRPTGEPIQEAFDRVRVADLWPDRDDRCNPGRNRLKIPPLSASLEPGNLGATPVFSNIHKRVFEETRWRRFLATEKGYMGLCPPHALKGDHIYLLPGGDVPFVLRPTGDEFKLVGGCYIHGIMNGEFFVELRARNDQSFDQTDLSWLDKLGDTCLPFETAEVVLI